MRLRNDVNDYSCSLAPTILAESGQGERATFGDLEIGPRYSGLVRRVPRSWVVVVGRCLQLGVSSVLVGLRAPGLFGPDTGRVEVEDDGVVDGAVDCGGAGHGFLRMWSPGRRPDCW